MARHNKKKKVIPKTRKELRKEKRQQKKENKKNFFGKKKSKPGEFVKKTAKPAEEEDFEDEIESDFDLSDEDVNNKLKTVKSATAPTPAPRNDRFLENQLKEKKKQQELEKKMRKRRIEQLKAANEDDDKIIRKLEKKLKIDKHKNEKSVHKMFNDGLDYALELCLPDNIQKMYSAAKEAAQAEDSDNEFEEDLQIALGKNKTEDKSAKKKGKDSKKSTEKQANEKNHLVRLSKAESKYFKDEYDSDISGTDSEFEHSDKEQDETLKDSDNSDFDIMGSEAEEEEGDGSEVEDEVDGSEVEDELNGNEVEDESDGSDSELQDNMSVNSEENDSDREEEDQENDKKLWEDIYGRKRDQDGNVLEENKSKYVPPHVRARQESTENVDAKRKEKLENLRRRCKGSLNRLSEANLHKIAADIENLYRSNPRFDMNNTMSDLVVEAIVSNVLAGERMVLEYAMLIAVLHANIGSEIGAHFLQILVSKFDNYMKELARLNVENKELDNTIFLICHLYTFKIFQHTLIYELINRLISSLCEKSVECLLLVLRSIGFQLRKDDPLALKDLILLIQKKANESPLEIKENPRLKFMLDVLNAIKNNNMTKIPQYDPSLSEHMKKILKSMMVNGKYVAPLNITMEDLLKADEKGKWWVVGSAWSGNIQDIKAAKTKTKSDSEKFSEQLLTLARQQRMNTDDRRNVFCIIMSAEDYVNAFERLLHLAIKDNRVIVSIIIHCCLSEKVFNPYYGVLAQKFCEYDRKYQLATQFALWDRIKDIQSASKQELQNLGQFIIYLVINGGLPISVLKVIEFAEMDKTTLRLVRQIMLGLLLGKEEECVQVFQRIAPSAKLKSFKDSIRLFMHHFLLKGSNKSDMASEQMEVLKTRINMVDSTLQSLDSKLKF